MRSESGAPTRRIALVAVVAAVLVFAAAAGDGRAQTSASIDRPSIALVEARLAEIDGVSDPGADLLRDLYRQALTELEATAGWQSSAMDFERRAGEASTAVAATETALAEAASGEVDRTAVTLDDADLRLAELERARAAATARLVALDTEPLRRSTRRAEIRQRLAQLATDARAVDDSLAAPRETGGTDAVMAARRTLLTARRMQLEGEMAALEQERVAYDAEVPLLPRQRDLAARDAARLDQQVGRLIVQVRELRRDDATRQAESAQSDAQGVYARWLTSLAQTNAALSMRRLVLVDEAARVDRQREAVLREYSTLTERYARTRQRVLAIGETPAVGLLLRNQRETLPNVRQYRRQAATYEAQSREIQTEQFDLDEQRGQLVDLDVAVATVRDDLRLFLDTPEDEADAVAAIRQVLQNQQAYLDALIGDLSRRFDVLVELGIAQHQIVTETEIFLDFVDERILWTRSGSAWGGLTSRGLARPSGGSSRHQRGRRPRGSWSPM